MAQISMFWQTNGTGHGPATGYTDAYWRAFLEAAFVHNPDTQGVFRYRDALEVTAGTGEVLVGIGAACIRGVFYQNGAEVHLAVPAAVSGTTAHRVVVRVDFAAQTATLVLISAADGVNTPPPAVQTEGTLWDITLATASRVIGGTITVTDARTYLQYNGDVLDTVPALLARQGNSSTIWNEAGTTNYTPERVLMQAGSYSEVVSPAAASGGFTITFPAPFAGVPLVFVTRTYLLTDPEPITFQVQANDTEALVVWNTFAGTIEAVALNWQAIGPRD
jgi:hypothetical protein